MFACLLPMKEHRVPLDERHDCISIGPPGLPGVAVGVSLSRGTDCGHEHPHRQAPWQGTLGDPGVGGRAGMTASRFPLWIIFFRFFVPRKEHHAADSDFDFGRTEFETAKPRSLPT